MIYALVITLCTLVNNQPVCVQGTIIEDANLKREVCEATAAEFNVLVSDVAGPWAAELKCLAKV